MREGFHKAIVTNNRDPENRGRVRLRVPHILGPAETGWASPMFATNVPAVGDQVYATFESGEQDRILFAPESGIGGPSSFSTNLDGGTSNSIYTSAQFIDGGGV